MNASNNLSSASLKASYDLSSSPWYWSIRGLIAFITVLGNGFIIFLIINTPRLHRSPNWFLLNLLVSDFCVGIINFPLGIICKFLATCNIYLSFPVLNTFLNASVVNLCLMSLDRYIAVIRPFRYQGYMTKCRIVLLIVSSWTIACGLSILYFALDDRHAQMYIILYLIIFEIVPAVFLVSAYTHMVIIGRRHIKRVTNMMSQLNFNYGGKSSSYYSNERSAVNVIGSVTMLFIVSYVMSVYLTLQMIAFKRKQPDILIFISTVMTHLNSALNFVVYALFKSDIRREMFSSRRVPVYESYRGQYNLSVKSTH